MSKRKKGRKINQGKIFEREFKNSVPEGVFFYRFRDGTSSFYGGGDGKNIRFQQSNICDCLLFNGQFLYLLELKSHAGKSLPFTAIRQNQLTELSNANTYPGMIAGFVVNFRDVGRTWFVPAAKVECFMAHEARKSIPLAWCEAEGTEIRGQKLKVHYRWDVRGFLSGKVPHGE